MTPMKKTIALILISLVTMMGMSSLHAQMENYNPNHDLDFSLIPFCKNKLYGFVDQNNKVVIKAQYESVSFFNTKGLAQANKLGVYGVINKKGETIVPFLSTRPIMAPNMTESVEGQSQTIPDVYHIYNSNSKKWCIFYDLDKPYSTKIYHDVKPKFDDKITSKYLDEARRVSFNNKTKKIIRESGMVNFINKQGKEIFKKDFINAYALSENSFAFFNSEGKMGICDINGHTVTKGTFREIKPTGSSEYFIVTSFSGPNNYSFFEGIVNAQGKLTVDTIYTSLRFIKDDLFTAKNDQGIGVMNGDGKIYLNPDYTSLIHFAKDLFIIKSKEDYKSYLIDLNANVVTKGYQDIKPCYRKTVSTAPDGEMTYIISEKGQELFSIPEKNVHVSEAYGGYYIIRHSNTNGLYSANGTPLLKNEYRSISQTNVDQTYLVQNENNYGLFEASKGWIHPLSENRINLRKNESKEDQIIYKRKQEIITYTSTMNNKSIEKVDQRDNAYVSVRDNVANVKLSTGEKISFDVKEKQRVQKHKDWIYVIQENRDRTRSIFDTQGKQLNPTGYFLSNVFELEDGIYFAVVKDRINIGVIDMEGRWFIEPKEHQVVRNLDKRFWEIGTAQDRALFTLDQKPLTKNGFTQFKIVNDYLITGHRNLDKGIDLMDYQGKIISSTKYSKIEAVGNYVAGQKKELLESCLLDSVGNLLQCYPYSEIKNVIEDKYIIVKDLHDFGIITMDGIEKVPFRYKGISYMKNVNLFALNKKEYEHELLNISFEAVGKKMNGFMRANEIREGLYHIDGEDEIWVLNNNGKLLITFDKELGKVHKSKRLNGTDFIKILSKQYEPVIANYKTGMIYQQ